MLQYYYTTPPGTKKKEQFENKNSQNHLSYIRFTEVVLASIYTKKIALPK